VRKHFQATPRPDLPLIAFELTLGGAVELSRLLMGLCCTKTVASSEE